MILIIEKSSSSSYEGTFTGAIKIDQFDNFR